jgi:hypothetical protein
MDTFLLLKFDVPLIFFLCKHENCRYCSWPHTHPTLLHGTESYYLFSGKMTGSGSSASGMFSSTLSARYDAHTTDRTWICVFCKNGPHCGVGGGGTSGDLFGPYLLTPPDKLDINADGSADERDITEEQKLSGGRNKRSLRGAHMVEQFCQKMSRKVHVGCTKRTH